MTLHDTVEDMKKAGLGTVIGICATIFLVILFRIGLVMKDTIFPPKVAPTNHAYDVLPAIHFPPNVSNKQFSYTINTVSGQLPSDFPDRLEVFQITHPQANLQDLTIARTKIAALDYRDASGNLAPEISVGNGEYEWDSADSMNKRFKMNIVNLDFSLTSDYLSSLIVLYGQSISDQQAAIAVAQDYMNKVQTPDDLDITKTQTPQDQIKAITTPQLFDVVNGALVSATSLATTKVIRVDFYQKNMAYDLDTGRKNAAPLKMNLPVLYPHPPYSTMSFWVGSGNSGAEVLSANFIHQEIKQPDPNDTTPAATYPIKSVDQAFQELKDGKAYIAGYSGTSSQILIDNVYLAYYIGEEPQDYLMPIIVFEGENGFFAYVSAVTDDWAK